MWLGCLELEISLICHKVHASKYARYIFCRQKIGRQGQKEVEKHTNSNRPSLLFVEDNSTDALFQKTFDDF